MNHHAAAGGRFPCLTEKRHAIKLTTLTTSTWWPSRMENPSKKVTLCYIYIFNFAQRVGSKHLQSNPLPHLVVLHQPYAGGYTSGGCLEQPNMLGNNKHYIFPFGILKGQMILYCHSTGGTTLEDVNECDCHAAEFHPELAAEVFLLRLLCRVTCLDIGLRWAPYRLSTSCFHRCP